MRVTLGSATFSLALIATLLPPREADAFGTDRAAWQERNNLAAAVALTRGQAATTQAQVRPQRLAATQSRQLGIGILPMPRGTKREPVKTHGILPMTRTTTAGGLNGRRAVRQEPQRGVVRQASLHPQRQMDPKFLPARVPFAGKYAAGTIVIDTEDKFLYLVQPGGMAERYGVGVGRPGFEWAGTHRVSMKKEWPGWTPPAQMRKRQPELPAYMPGGPENPLGARALYLGSTLYRIHGSNAPWSIGHAVSSGCIRMRNEDVIALYEKVNVGTKVVVLR